MSLPSVSYLSKRPLAIATLIATFGAIGANFWFNRFPPQGKTIAELANTTYADVLFIPASYAFAIWGLIYCGLIAFSFYQLKLSQLKLSQRYEFVFQARPWLILACILQSLWVYTFIQQFLATSTAIMAALLLTIMQCYRLLGVGQKTLSNRDRWLLHYPFSIYLAWISVATIVNVSILLYETGWNGWGIAAPIWTSIMMGIAALHAGAVYQQRHDRAYVLVVIWALIALVVRYLALPLIVGSGIIFSLGLLGLLFLDIVKGDRQYDL
ncbi:tryptophan-rich sensory protein [Alkalinema sp. FACHB-956]|uniref:tryptophan-rich sensory protein n=1 Tax=Alkalinema sp. FACHB-956 TaxID=2692768 RepID=UPI0016850A27|nr:tryptophan-rich sensory protein [Alkalinema sp. FACHB-956]MBD2327918.1 tryptophan-rich sensory protein [Alkalinema sp. FACHB-956]